ncbi:competence protein CoiA [Catenulispora sp. MAP12-49]|uniref:competence protein CoiA n=1 Tax=Catenulispora sp. MAP12-49 TaxID=3156302 RepID=UPI003519686A
MLIASNPDGDRILATRDLESGSYQCPMCQSDVVLKRGRKVAAHFAHLPNATCRFAEAESWRHLLAKQVLLEEFTVRGWRAQLEVANVKAGRRVDVGVEVRAADGTAVYVAVEVQDSPISVEMMRARMRADRRIGYQATAWLFTSHRAVALTIAHGGDLETRVPNEMLYVANRYGLDVPIIDPEQRRIFRARLSRVTRPGEYREWYTPEGDHESVDYPDRVLRNTRKVPAVVEGGFNISLHPGKFGDLWAVEFCQ